MRASRGESEQRSSLSGDLLGKFSAIVRRSSQFRTGADDDNNNNQHYLLGGDQSPLGSGIMVAPPPTLSATHAAKGFGFNFAANMRRFSKAASPSTTTTANEESVDMPSQSMEAAMDRVLAEPERQRRYDLEVMSFALLHEHFQPAHAPELDDDDDYDLDLDEDDDNNQAVDGDEDVEEEAVRRRSRQSTAEVDGNDEDDDDDDNVLIVRLKRKETATSSSSVSDERDEDDEDEDHESNNAEELNFDRPNLNASVRKLVLQIESASMNNVDSSVSSSNSNQEDDAQEERDKLHPLDHDIARRVTYPVVPYNAYVPPPRVIGQSNYIPMDEVQEELTQSVRRLVIGLKDDSEAQEENNNNSSGSSAMPFARRRGNSCPPPYRPPARSSAVDSSASTAASITMDTGPSEPPRWRKRSAFARLAPKFLDTFRRKRKSYLYTDEELESIEGARWKIVELAFRFGGKHRFYLVQAVNMFEQLIKYGRHGGPHPTRLHCNRCGTLQWQHKRGGLSDPVDLADVLQIIEGRQTAVFHKYATSTALENNSLSLIFKERTLDLETPSASHRDWLMSALRTLVAYARKQREAEQRAIAERAVMSLGDISEASVSSASRSRVVYHTSRADAGPRLLW